MTFIWLILPAHCSTCVLFHITFLCIYSNALSFVITCFLSFRSSFFSLCFSCREFFSSRLLVYQCYQCLCAHLFSTTFNHNWNMNLMSKCGYKGDMDWSSYYWNYDSDAQRWSWKKKRRWTHGKHEDVSHSGYSWCRTHSSSAYLHQESQGFDKLDCPIVLKSFAFGPTVPQKSWNLHPLCQWWHIDPVSLGVHELLVFLMRCGALSLVSVCGWAGKFYCLTVTYKFMCWIIPDNIQGRQSYGKTENYYKTWSLVLLSSWKLYFLKSKFEFDLMFSRSSGVNCSRCKSCLHLPPTEGRAV